MISRLLVVACSIQFAALFFPAPVLAESNLGLAFPQELEADLSAGATAIYHLDFESANRHLQHAIQIRPDHPAAYFFLTMSKWYELSYDSLLNRNPKLEEMFEDQAERTIEVAKKYSKNPETEAVGHLYWAGGLGAKGWHYVARRQWVRAYFSGKKGYNMLAKIIETDPTLYDAYLGVGMYEYYAATLGPVLKALSSFLVRGNKEKAFRYLHLAETRSRYVKLETSYFLWNAAIDEGRLGEAIEKIQTMVRTLPHSPLFLWCEIQTLYVQKRWEDVLKRCEDFAYHAHAGPQLQDFQPPYQLILSKVYFHAGAAAFNLKNYSSARGYFEKSVAEPSQFEGWHAMSHLRLGELDDLEKQREHALEHYRVVLRYPDYWGSHRLAKERLKRPFQLTAETEIIPTPLQGWREDLD